METNPVNDVSTPLPAVPAMPAAPAAHGSRAGQRVSLIDATGICCPVAWFA